MEQENSFSPFQYEVNESLDGKKNPLLSFLAVFFYFKFCDVYIAHYVVMFARFHQIK